MGPLYCCSSIAEGLKTCTFGYVFQCTCTAHKLWTSVLMAGAYFTVDGRRVLFRPIHDCGEVQT